MEKYLSRNQKKGRVASNSVRGETSTRRPLSCEFVSASHPLASIFLRDQTGQPGPLEGAGDTEVAVVPQHPGWLNDVMGELSKASPRQQVAIGGISGWASGYLFCKVGKGAALALGGSIILYQIAQYQGLIKVNWANVERTFERTRRHFSQQMHDNMPDFLDDVREFGQRHGFLVGSFLAGFLLGVCT